MEPEETGTLGDSRYEKRVEDMHDGPKEDRWESSPSETVDATGVELSIHSSGDTPRATMETSMGLRN